IGNALKYSQFDTPIYIKSKLVDGYLKIKIQNFGEPIPLDEIPKLFNLFYRGRNASSTKGYGIGLAIVKKAVDALKGIIEVESSLENGTIFTILLPTRVQV
ncbi:MAG: sensor histidine kinase, partial [Candidatus Kapaibacteriota bacterium]